MAKAKTDTLPYELDALECLNSFDFPRYPTTTIFALKAVAESIWSILIM